MTIARNSILKCTNEYFELSPFERNRLYYKFSRKIDRVAFNIAGNSKHQKAMLVANCKLIIKVLLEHTDKSMAAWIGLEELYKLTDIPKKEALNGIKFLNDTGLLIRHRGQGITLLPPTNDETSIFDIYSTLLNGKEN